MAKNSTWKHTLERLTTAQRDNAEDGENAIIFNTTTAQIEYWNGSAWVSTGSGGGGGGPLETVNSNNVQFDSTSGKYYGSFSSPRSGTITLDDTDAVAGGLAIVYYQDTALDLSDTPRYSQGTIDVSLVNKIYIERDAEGDYSINIVNPEPEINIANFTTIDPTIVQSPTEVYATPTTGFSRTASTDPITGDFAFEILVEDNAVDIDIMMGATEGAHGQWNQVDWDYGFWIQEGTGNLQVLESGVAGDPDVITVLPYNTGDKLKIVKVGTVVTGRLNDTIIHTFPTASNNDCRLTIVPTDSASGYRVRFPRYTK